jgi:chemotaxis protein methyltransferase CheR
MTPDDVEELAIKLFLEALQQAYGYDFRQYSGASLRRRLMLLVDRLKIPSVAHLQAEVLQRPELLPTVISALTVPTSEMFRDPEVYKALREQVFPVLRTYPSFKIWHAGCSTGEEVYSLAIALKEEGLDERAVIYATDINVAALTAAKDGIFPTESLKTATANYQRSGGRAEFSSYYTAAYGGARMDPSLRKNVLFTTHNLAADEVFAEVHLVLCRNVLIYFTRELQQRVVDLFRRSLSYKGFLCLGTKETVQFLEVGRAFAELPGAQRIFRKIEERSAGAPSFGAFAASGGKGGRA